MRRAALSGLALALLLGSVAHALPPDSHVVVIGNGFGEPGEVGLRYAHDDARAVAEVLRALGDVPSTRITTLLDGSADDVQQTLAGLAPRLAGASVLVVFYSGHADAEGLHLGGTSLPFAALQAQIRALPARMKLLVIDACRSGNATRVKGLRPAPEFRVDFADEALAEGMAIITSSTAGETSQESDALQASFFSHHLVNALRGAGDRDGDGAVTLAEAYAYAYDGTLRSSGRTLDLQHPTYAWDVKGRGDLVLTRVADADQRVGRLELGEPTVHLVTDAVAGQVVAEVKPSRAGATLALPPRRYRVQERQARAYLEYDVTLRAGEVVALRDRPRQRIEYDRLVRKGGGERTVVHGLRALVGVRSQLVADEGAMPQLTLGYSVDTPWFSGELRGRAGQVSASAPEGRAPRRHEEYAGALVLSRAVDLAWLTVGLGLVGEVAVHRQVFTDGDAPTRQSTTGGFGALAAAERWLGGGLALRLEGGPMATVLRAGEVELGGEVDVGQQTALVWWAAGGLTWRL
ncbi:MAG: caspase family protein [Myxococcales bacterium]|nr:caspase family protein [Myxococcales bacterium]